MRHTSDVHATYEQEYVCDGTDDRVVEDAAGFAAGTTERRPVYGVAYTQAHASARTRAQHDLDVAGHISSGVFMKWPRGSRHHADMAMPFFWQYSKVASSLP